MLPYADMIFNRLYINALNLALTRLQNSYIRLSHRSVSLVWCREIPSNRSMSLVVLCREISINQSMSLVVWCREIQ